MAGFHFYCPIDVRYGDLDPQGHVNNAKFLTYFEQARVEYMRHLGLLDKDGSFLDLGLIVADAHVSFRIPVRWNMEVRVGVRAGRIGNKSILVEYHMIDEKTGAELATGSTVLVGFDYRAQKTIPIPDDWRAKINAFEEKASN